MAGLEMSLIELIAGGFLVLCCLIIIVAVSMQSSKGDGLSSAIMGGGGGSGRERSKSTDAKLATLTKWLVALFFLVTLGVNVVSLLGL